MFRCREFKAEHASGGGGGSRSGSGGAGEGEIDKSHDLPCAPFLSVSSLLHLNDEREIFLTIERRNCSNLELN